MPETPMYTLSLSHEEAMVLSLMYSLGACGVMQDARGLLEGLAHHDNLRQTLGAGPFLASAEKVAKLVREVKKNEEVTYGRTRTTLPRKE